MRGGLPSCLKGRGLTAARVLVIIAIIVILIAIGLAAAYVSLSSVSTASTYNSLTSSTSTAPSSSVTLTTPSVTSAGGNYTSSWLTYHMNLARDGYDPNEPSYKTLASVEVWKSPTLDGDIYAEPLIYNGAVYAVTENNSVYALSETTGQVIWRENLGTPVPGNTLPCGDIDPSGITSTPVIDPTLNEIFVVAYTYPPQHHVLFALNLHDGSTVFQRIVDPPGVSPLVEQQRAALSLANGIIYIPFGGLAGDCGQYHGYLLGVNEDNSSATLSYQVPTGREGAIWAPAGIGIDSTGIFVSTGNSANDTTFDFGNAVIHLNFSLNETDYFAPTNWASLNDGDTDVGSVEPALLGNNTIFQIGKEGVGYLLKESKLGGIGGQEFSQKLCDASFGGTAYASPVIYVPCTNGMYALQINSQKPSFSVNWNRTGFDAGSPIVTGGAVWTIDQNTGMLYAFDASNGTQVFSYDLGTVVHFESPSSAGGQVFAAGDNSIIAFSV